VKQAITPAGDGMAGPGVKDLRIERDPKVIFAPARVTCERRGDGTIHLRSPLSLAPHARCVGEWLVQWAERAPRRTCLAERDPTGWRRLSYAEALTRVEAIATWLHEAGLGPERPLVVLSDNSIEHALLALAALHVGVPVASISVAYSLASSDHAKLKAIVSSLTPGLIYVSSAGAFSQALHAIADLHDAQVVTGDADQSTEGAGPIIPFSRLLERTDPSRVSRAFAAVGPDTVAKILFTSGSTGAPKGVINTHRMLCSNQQAMAQVWPFLEETPPVIVDWLPWSHTFGGNHNFFLVLRNGGTLYIDAGKPVPGAFERTLTNLREVSPTIYCNVPRGYDLLASALRTDAELRRGFFARLQVLLYAAAALPKQPWDELIELSKGKAGDPIAIVSAWGSTETAPLATSCHFQAERPGNIGLPVPGTELKLVPVAGKLEVRVRGPGIMPGYWRAPGATAAAFDDEGYYRIGDAMRFADPEHPERGLIFDGRIAEDFKLSSGTWVSVGSLRLLGIEALAPIAQDIVVSGHDLDFVAFLVVPNVVACREIAGLSQDAPIAQVLTAPQVRARVREGLRQLHAKTGGASSMHAKRALLMEEPLSSDAGEITDKGYVNQRAVLARRAPLVERLHGPGLHEAIVVLQQGGRKR